MEKIDNPLECIDEIASSKGLTSTDYISQFGPIPPILPNEVRIASWNVNGIRSKSQELLGENPKMQILLDLFSPDIICLQETKAQHSQLSKIGNWFENKNYSCFWACSSERKGYSGTAIISKEEPITLWCGIPNQTNIFSGEGRMITAQFEKFYLVNVYVPNTGTERGRTNRLEIWEPLFAEFLASLNKPVIVTGDFNVARTPMDIWKVPTGKRIPAGYSDEERASFESLLDSGLVDVWRNLNPEDERTYTWWDFKWRAREKRSSDWPSGRGWRIDYFLVSNSIMDKVRNMITFNRIPEPLGILGSDHCPIGLIINL